MSCAPIVRGHQLLLKLREHLQSTKLRYSRAGILIILCIHRYVNCRQ